MNEQESAYVSAAVSLGQSGQGSRVSGKNYQGDLEASFLRLYLQGISTVYQDFSFEVGMIAGMLTSAWTLARHEPSITTVETINRWAAVAQSLEDTLPEDFNFTVCLSASFLTCASLTSGIWARNDWAVAHQVVDHYMVHLGFLEQKIAELG